MDGSKPRSKAGRAPGPRAPTRAHLEARSGLLLPRAVFHHGRPPAARAAAAGAARRCGARSRGEPGARHRRRRGASARPGAGRRPGVRGEPGRGDWPSPVARRRGSGWRWPKGLNETGRSPRPSARSRTSCRTRSSRPSWPTPAGAGWAHGLRPRGARRQKLTSPRWHEQDSASCRPQGGRGFRAVRARGGEPRRSRAVDVQPMTRQALAGAASSSPSAASR